MGYLSPKKSPKKNLRINIKNKHHRDNTASTEEKHTPTEQEITEITLKRLHTLGTQKFGAFPYSEHFNRWIATVEGVLAEFTSNPNIGIDDQFSSDCQHTLSNIKLTLEQIRRREATIDQELNNLSERKNHLQQINNKYATQTSSLRSQKNNEIRHLNREIEQLKKEQNIIVKIKAGFFHRVSKKERERREIDVIEELTAKQTNLERVTLDLKQAQKTLREEFDNRKEPVLEDIKKVQKRIEDLETDSSLEERWFACEAIVDALNMFLLRKAAQPP
jgi:chromosome segregation ATPase